MEEEEPAGIREASSSGPTGSRLSSAIVMDPIENPSNNVLGAMDAGKPTPELLEDDELTVKGLPQLYFPCVTVTISNEYVLKKAAEKLGVPIHGYNITSLDDGDITASVAMDVPPHKHAPVMKRQEFYGEWTKFGSEAKESACLASLTHLQDVGLIVVHDTNFAKMKEYKRAFDKERFWSSMMYERASSLKEQLSAATSVAMPTEDSLVAQGESTTPRTGEKASASGSKAMREVFIRSPLRAGHCS